MPILGTSAVRARAAPATPAPPRHTAKSMIAGFTTAGLSEHVSLITDLAAMPERLTALNARDSTGAHRTFDHILRAARAPAGIADVNTKALAADLLGIVGHARRPQESLQTRCYGRTSHTIFTMHHPAEFARLIVDLAVDGKTTLANGEVVTWDTQRAPYNVRLVAADFLWAGLNHAAKAQTPGAGLVLTAQGEYAFKGEMANLWSRLTGEQHVNVDGRSPKVLGALPKIVARTGPLLAEYNPHAGSVSGFDDEGQPLSMETGRPEPVRIHDTHINNFHLLLGYVVVPAKAAKTFDLPVIKYPNSEQGYMPWPAGVSQPKTETTEI